MRNKILFVLVAAIFLLNVAVVFAHPHERNFFRGHDGELISFLGYNMDDMERHNTVFSGWIEERDDELFGRASFNSKGIDCEGRKVYYLEFDGELSEIIDEEDDHGAIFKGTVVIRDYRSENIRPKRSNAELRVVYDKDDHTADIALYRHGEWIGEVDDMPIR